MLGKNGKIALRVLASLVLALAIAEAVERLVDSVPSIATIAKGRYRLAANPRLGYEPIPNMSAENSHASFMDYMEVSNSLGFRDYEHAEKSAGVHRILVLGDSVTSGHFIKHYTDAFPALLEEKLKARGLDVEVLNFGVNGYNTQQEVEILRDRGLAFDPDVVVVAYCLNDRVRSDGGLLNMLLTIGKDERPTWTRLGKVVGQSQLARMLEYRYRSSQSITSEYKPLFKDTVAESFQELHRLSEDNGFWPLVAILPDFRDLDSDSFKGDYSAVEKLADNASLASLQMLPLAQECKNSGAKRLYRDLYHPTVAGHQCMAEGLASRIAIQLGETAAPPSP